MPDLSRRSLLRIGATTATATGLGALGATAAEAASGSGHPPHPDSPTRAARCQEFDEFYRGRRIVVRCAPPDGHHRRAAADDDVGVQVFIDGEELHVMGNADGSYVSVVNHFEPQPTPLAVARTAVDGLAGADLVPAEDQASGRTPGRTRSRTPGRK